MAVSVRSAFPQLTKARKIHKFRRAAMATIAILFATASANAKTFRNAYVSFELGEKWNCTLEHTEWVCRTSDPGLAEAIIVLTAKEVGPQDALPAYESHLKQPRTVMSKTGASTSSTVYRVEERKIAGHPWIDGMHFASEVPNYYTRYLATTKDKIAVLVTFSAHKLHYTKYSADFFKAIESLRVIATRALMNPAGSGNGLGGGEQFGGALPGGDFPAEPGAAGDEGYGDSDKSETAKNLLAGALILGAAGFYFLVLKKKKKRRR